MNTPTTGISKFLGKLVRRLFDKHVRSTTIIDGVHFIRLSKRCTANDCLKTTTYLCTFDITDIYTVLPQEESLDILTEFLQYGYRKVKRISIDAI
ncbi:unnamed protein product [Rotaria sp. Silwood2]|nr:unnamed protein product [Rotaria sp. Silwood2]